jgi:hypothetical protein
MNPRIGRAADTLRASWYLLRLHWLFRAGGQRAVARVTADAMRVEPSSQDLVDRRGIDAWHAGRAVWRAKRLFPMRSTCLQTALATQMLFASKGLWAAVRVGVAEVGADAHAWAEIGDFVLDDQRLSNNFKAFDAPVAASEKARV